MKNEKFTRDQLNSLDKDILITLLLGMQDQMAQQTIAIEKLTEQIALMNTRTFGKKSEKIQLDENQLNFFSEILNEAESLIDGQLSIEPSMDEVVVPAHKRRKRKGKLDEDLMISIPKSSNTHCRKTHWRNTSHKDTKDFLTRCTKNWN